MRIIFREPGKSPRTMIVPNDLETLQDLVGGLIEHIQLKPGLGLIINEEGKLRGMENNFFLPAINDMIVGPAVFVGEDGEEFSDISEYDHAMIMMYFEAELDALGGKP